MTAYSHSKLSTFEQCPQKYKFRYIDKIKVLKKSIEAFLGSIVHETLEWIHNEVKSERIPNIDEAVIFYSKSWEQKYNQDIYIVKKELTIKDYFNTGIRFILGYYTRNCPFNENTLETEKRIEVNLDDLKKNKIVGIIDRLVYNKEKEEYEIHDYKTGNTLPAQEKIESDRQLALYSIAIKNEFGKDKKTKLIWHYLAFDTKIYSERTNEQLEQLKKETLELIKKIENEKEFPTKKSPLCNWCEYKPICPAWKDVNNKKSLNKDFS